MKLSTIPQIHRWLRWQHFFGRYLLVECSSYALEAFRERYKVTADDRMRWYSPPDRVVRFQLQAVPWRMEEKRPTHYISPFISQGRVLKPNAVWANATRELVVVFARWPWQKTMKQVLFLRERDYLERDAVRFAPDETPLRYPQK